MEAMASGLESEAVFEARAVQMGISNAVIAQLKAGGIGTLGGYAFCCSFQPGAVDEAPLITALTALLGGQAPDVGLMSKLRRLFYEAHTTALVDMRSRIESSPDEQPRRVQLPERLARLDQLKTRYPGLSITGEYEFSFALLDKVTDQFDRNELKFIPLEECTKRSQELDGLKKDDILKIEVRKDDTLKLEREQAKTTVRLATDLEIRNAFVRRALAYDAGGLLTFSTHEAWISKLFRIMQEPAIEGHAAVSLQQVYRADKRLWAKMADDTRGNIVPPVGGPKPLDVSMNKFMDHVEVTFLLLPLPLYGYGATFQTGSAPFVVPPGKGAHWNHHERDSPYGTPGKGTSKGKGKKGSKGDKNPKVSPAGCAFQLSNGKPCCIFFNGPNGCNNKSVSVGKRCSRGFHNCGKVLANKKVCGGEHSMLACSAI